MADAPFSSQGRPEVQGGRNPASKHTRQVSIFVSRYLDFCSGHCVLFILHCRNWCSRSLCKHRLCKHTPLILTFLTSQPSVPCLYWPGKYYRLSHYHQSQRKPGFSSFYSIPYGDHRVWPPSVSLIFRYGGSRQLLCPHLQLGLFSLRL